MSCRRCIFRKAREKKRFRSIPNIIRNKYEGSERSGIGLPYDFVPSDPFATTLSHMQVLYLQATQLRQKRLLNVLTPPITYFRQAHQVQIVFFFRAFRKIHLLPDIIWYVLCNEDSCCPKCFWGCSSEMQNHAVRSVCYDFFFYGVAAGISPTRMTGSQRSGLFRAGWRDQPAKMPVT